MMKKGFGLVEIIIVLLIFLSLYMTCFKTHKRLNPFDDGTTKIQTQKIDEKINEIEQTKMLKQKIEENLEKGY
jgi:prepilin-type N-terminal cleavage/methylation domain-containing protein